jgi:hypothetical protein
MRVSLRPLIRESFHALTASGLTEGLALARGGSMIAGMNRLELFVLRKRLNPYVSKELVERIQSSIVFLTPTGAKAYGYNAEIIVELCESVLAARQAGVLQTLRRNFS